MPHRDAAPPRHGPPVYRHRNAGCEGLVEFVMRNNNINHRTDLVRAQTKRIRAQESREQRLWDLNHDRSYPPPDYYGQREPQNKPPVTSSAAPGEPSQEGHRLDETKLAIDKILNASSDLEVLLGRAHTRLGTLAFLTAGLPVERDLSTGPNPIISVPCLANSMNKSFVPQVNEAFLPAPELRSSGIQLDSPFSLPQTLIMDTRLRASIVPNFRGSDIASLAPCS
ncbi:unnamed protein product [Rhizoctonia solani]|uniref:Uncharacterized protein n=1 Tax=Rhizoctonia solani TaxID=456999 RepID=A0A8H3CWN3_9AGAM|nr:unnamed protein product [Rhizoctonia solani]